MPSLVKIQSMVGLLTLKLKQSWTAEPRTEHKVTTPMTWNMPAYIRDGGRIYATTQI